MLFLFLFSYFQFFSQTIRVQNSALVYDSCEEMCVLIYKNKYENNIPIFTIETASMHPRCLVDFHQQSIK